ncbi:hypothetical protein EYF80_062854 [Liparis tanakae]|uniref:Uncharacterized protein n=1 Tax=Liparis tanakae TaxID=230148 RepID=A0A4Z2EFA5_9TELE|nr:hypothetical protein EYF80_062854 [Liparis tanakae]
MMSSCDIMLNHSYSATAKGAGSVDVRRHGAIRLAQTQRNKKQLQKTSEGNFCSGPVCKTCSRKEKHPEEERSVSGTPPGASYMLNAHFSFCSSLPRDVTLSAMMNSRKSIVPSPLASNVRKTCSANLEASP